MANRYGTDEVVFQTITGTLQSDDGSPLLSTSSDGGTAYALGGALSAGIYSGIQNGNLASPPQSIGTGNPISADNPLPYFTFVDSTSSGRITAYAVEDSTQASGYAIRFQAVGAQAGDKAYLERNIAIPSSRAQSYMFSARSTWYAGTNNANYRAFVQSQYLKADGTSTTGTLGSGTRSGTALANAVEIYALGNASGAIPTDGASLLYQTGISFASAVAGTVTVDLVEMRLVTGTTVTPYVDQTNPGSYGGYVGLSDSLLQIAANGYGTAGSNPTIFLSGNTGTIYLNAAGTISGGGTPTSGDIELRTKEGGFVYIGEGTANANIKLYESDGTALAISRPLYLTSYTIAEYDKGGSSDTTTITTAGTYYALTNAEVSFTPTYIGQRFLVTMTAYASLNTTTIQYAFVRSQIVDSSNTVIETLGFSRADNFGTSGRGATVAFTKVWTADAVATRKYKLSGTTQTTNGLTLSLAYTQMQVIPIG